MQDLRLTRLQYKYLPGLELRPPSNLADCFTLMVFFASHQTCLLSFARTPKAVSGDASSSQTFHSWVTHHVQAVQDVSNCVNVMWAVGPKGGPYGQRPTRPTVIIIPTKTQHMATMNSVEMARTLCPLLSRLWHSGILFPPSVLLPEPNSQPFSPEDQAAEGLYPQIILGPDFTCALRSVQAALVLCA